MYYSSFDEDGRSDIKSHNLDSGETSNFTETSEREYSPTVTPDGKFVSCIIQRDNGAQYLGKFPIDVGVPVILIDDLIVGYHAWITTPTWRTVNYGEIRIRRRAYFYGGSNYGNDRNTVDRLQASNKLNDAATKVKIEGIAIVREFNEVGAKLASEYGFEFERWTPADIR